MLKQLLVQQDKKEVFIRKSKTKKRSLKRPPTISLSPN